MKGVIYAFGAIAALAVIVLIFAGDDSSSVATSQESTTVTDTASADSSEALAPAATPDMNTPKTLTIKTHPA